MTREIIIQNGDVEQIVHDNDRYQAYHVEVTGSADVRGSHQEHTALEGTTFKSGQRHTIRNLRNKPFFVGAHDGQSKIRVSQAAAEVESQPENEVDASIDSTIDVENRAPRQIGKARLMDSGQTLIDPATETSLTSSQPREIDTWSAGALDVSPVQVQNSNSSTIDPALAAEYPESVSVEHDLFNTGDLTVTVDVSRTVSVIIAGNSVDNGNWSASVDWVDGNGNVYQTQSKSDIALSSVNNDNARLIRKAPRAEVTFTDESGAQNRLNAFVDAHR